MSFEPDFLENIQSMKWPITGKAQNVLSCHESTD
jgi:hypothetical protein